MLSQTPEMHRVFEIIHMAAQTDMTVLVQGETGTGKELVANAIHFTANGAGSVRGDEVRWYSGEPVRKRALRL